MRPAADRLRTSISYARSDASDFAEYIVVLVEAAGEVLPDARWQRCVEHWYRNAFAHIRAPRRRSSR